MICLAGILVAFILGIVLCFIVVGAALAEPPEEFWSERNT